jgi:hypothetical protein
MHCAGWQLSGGGGPPLDVQAPSTQLCPAGQPPQFSVPPQPSEIVPQATEQVVIGVQHELFAAHS